jgi:hypothetical protein
MHIALSAATQNTAPRTLLVALATAALLSACTGEQGGATKTTGQPSVAAADTAAPAGAGGMAGMAGMEGHDMKGGDMKGHDMGGMMGGGMMANMQEHMRMMQGAGADSMRAMMPMHRQMAANMLAQMNREMRDMNMAGDPAWNATVDSVRQDLARMPEAGTGDMTAHHGRMMRLMDMHQRMMQNMKR